MHTLPFVLPPLRPLDRPRSARKSRMAVAATVLGSVGLLTFCLVVPSLLAVVFGFVALRTIERDESTGRGAAIVGIVLGLLGLILGIGAQFVSAMGPDGRPIPGAAVSAADRQTLWKLDLLRDGETIELFYSDGVISVSESGAMLTNTRLVAWGGSGMQNSCRFEDITHIDFSPSRRWFDYGDFVVRRRGGEPVCFSISRGGDRIFDDALRLRTAFRSDRNASQPGSHGTPSSSSIRIDAHNSATVFVGEADTCFSVE